MTVVEYVTAESDFSLEAKEFRRDSITLSWEDRRQGHGRRRSDQGLDFAISLPPGTVLKAGDNFVLEAEQTIVAVIEAHEPVYVMKPKTPQEFAYFAYHVGNRHQVLMIGSEELVFLQNPAVRSLLEQLRADFTTDQRPFTAALATVHAH
jgi:urease accessory protein UreE